LFYYLIKIPIRLALLLFCRDTRIHNREALGLRGPLLITANHPNSFLDAIIIGAWFHRPVHFLARGDAFNKPWHARLLRLLNMIPVYRISEGKENLHRNDYAFEQCKKILSGDGIVLIFIEGISINSHELQPFKKGAARIAIENSALNNLRVLPLAIAYDSLVRFGKSINIAIGNAIPVNSLLPFDEEAKNMRHFNEQLFPEIGLLIDIPKKKETSSVEKIFCFIPACAGYILHIIPYSAVKSFVSVKTKGTIFYDSVLFGLLFLLYPLYLVLLAFLLCAMGLASSFIWLILVLHPITAYCLLKYR
jgi:1-acyl-sn-glycerol-3-phosphate acyltransferase